MKLDEEPCVHSLECWHEHPLTQSPEVPTIGHHRTLWLEEGKTDEKSHDHQQKLTGATIWSPSPLSLTYNLNNMLYKIVKWQALILKSTKNSRAFKSIEKKKSLCSCWESAMSTCKCWASPVGERKRNPPNLTKYFLIPTATASLGSGPPETLSKACVMWKTRSVSSCHKQHTGWEKQPFVSARRAPSEGISAKLKLAEILLFISRTILLKGITNQGVPLWYGIQTARHVSMTRGE